MRTRLKSELSWVRSLVHDLPLIEGEPKMASAPLAVRLHSFILLLNVRAGRDLRCQPSRALWGKPK